jgi:predicted lipoprotein
MRAVVRPDPQRVTPGRPSRPAFLTGRVIGIALLVVLLVAMALSTKVVDSNAVSGSTVKAFSPSAWGKANFPKVQAGISKRAVSATTLASAVASNATAAGKKYGVDAGTGPEVSVKFSGVLGKGAAGIYPVKVAGLPKGLLIRIQTGPAINGTDLRDAPGTIKFGQFKNQIDYQNAAAALNKQLKAQVLTKVATGNLTGKRVSVVGAFQLINPQAWLVTPAKLSVQ